MGRYVTDLVEVLEKMRDIAKENEEKFRTNAKNVMIERPKKGSLKLVTWCWLYRNSDNVIHGFSQVLSGP